MDIFLDNNMMAASSNQVLLLLHTPLLHVLKNIKKKLYVHTF